MSNLLALQCEATPTRPIPDHVPPLLFAAVGLGGEAGELLNVVKKLTREAGEGQVIGKRRAQVRDEAGDILFYLRLVLLELDLTLEDAAEALMDKLEAKR